MNKEEIAERTADLVANVIHGALLKAAPHHYLDAARAALYSSLEEIRSVGRDMYSTHLHKQPIGGLIEFQIDGGRSLSMNAVFDVSETKGAFTVLDVASNRNLAVAIRYEAGVGRWIGNALDASGNPVPGSVVIAQYLSQQIAR